MQAARFVAAKGTCRREALSLQLRAHTGQRMDANRRLRWATLDVPVRGNLPGKRKSGINAPGAFDSGGLRLKRADWRAFQWTEDAASKSAQLEFDWSYPSLNHKIDDLVDQ